MPDDPNNELLPPDSVGRGELRALDLRDPKDMKTAHEAITSWPRRFAALREETRAAMVQGLAEGMTIARSMMENPDTEIQAEGAKIAAMAARVATAMDRAELAQELALLHKLVPNAGEEKGKGGAQGPPTIIVQVVNQVQQGKQ